MRGTELESGTRRAARTVSWGSGLSRRCRRPGGGTQRRGFTMVELMAVMLIIGIMTSTLLFALYTVQQQSKVTRTRTQIVKLNDLLREKYESYRTRAIPLRIPPAIRNNPNAIARLRLLALRELMRMELPDRITDLLDPPPPPAVPTAPLLLTPPTLYEAYQKRMAQNPSAWTPEFQGAECLYMIVAAMRDGDLPALARFTPAEIGDTDGDGMQEILDGFGQPIEFLRWAPGFSETRGPDLEWGAAGVDDDMDGVPGNTSEAAFPGSDDELSPSFIQTVNAVKAPDPFDRRRIDPRWRMPPTDAIGNEPFALYPLVISAGKDRVYDITLDDPGMPLRYATTEYPSGTPWPNDPYVTLSTGSQLGRPVDLGGDGPNHVDNITNHNIEVD